MSQKTRYALVAPPYVPYAPALARAGVDLARTIVVEPDAVREAPWAAEQALRAGACGAVLLCRDEVEPRALRRLQLAAGPAAVSGCCFAPCVMPGRVRRRPCDCGFEELPGAGGGSRWPCSSAAAAGRPDRLPWRWIMSLEETRGRLWVGLYLPEFALEVFARASRSAEPLAVCEGNGRTQQIVCANAAARRLGVLPGLSSRAALALGSALRIRCRR